MCNLKFTIMKTSAIKNTIFTTLLVFLINIAFANENTELVVNNYNPWSYQINIQGRNYHIGNGETIIKDIRAGNILIEVYRIREFRGHNSKEYVGKTFVYLYPNMKLFAEINSQDNFLIVNKYPSTYSRNHSYKSSKHKQSSCSNRIVENDFDDFYNYVSRLSFDDNRRDAILSKLEYSQLYSYQIARLIELLSFDSSRKRIAIEAYHNTIDKEYYGLVIDALIYNSSKREVEDVIYNRKLSYSSFKHRR